jgi:3-oxoacyl-[acyl-carrier-protein] synthase II
MVVTGYGYVNSTGFGGSHSRVTWQDAGVDNPFKARWRTVSDAPFERFGRVNALGRCVLIAVEMVGLGDTLPQGVPRRKHADLSPATLGIVLGTEYGCIDTDLAFTRSMDEPGGASPTLFSYTLPSVAVGEVAIRYGITGPNLCVLSGPESGLTALWEGAALVLDGEVSGCLCVGGDAVSPGTGMPGDMNGSGVFAAHAVLVETEASAAAHGRTPLAALRVESAPRSAPRAWDLEGLCAYLGGEDVFARGLISLPAPGTWKQCETLVAERLPAT